MQWWTRLKTFLSEVVVETKKTTVVVIASFIFGIYLYLCDLVFLLLRNRLFDVFKVFS